MLVDYVSLFDSSSDETYFAPIHSITNPYLRRSVDVVIRVVALEWIFQFNHRTHVLYILGEPKLTEGILAETENLV